ncbi:unnamed protein product [Paramecium octaurelia]|uniref:Biogenesis of lysosome-related organelles complex 1 subunit 1 n=1 Tax=Paramecium octaurelia TaxID=43137 RepID=A0A8S1XHP2_PAROT|nr:unnamed protein product [Paramecium octaurelia]
MFDTIMKEYNQNKKVLDKQDENLRRHIGMLAEPMTKKVLHGLNANIAILHQNEQIIEKETKQLLKETAQLQKESQQWQILYNNLNETLKKVGDIVNFAQIIENELQELCES